MPDSREQTGNPAIIAHFLVTVGDHDISLRSVSDLHDVMEEPEDSGHRRYIILKRAVTSDRFLYHWYRDTRLGKDTTANVIIRLLNAAGGDVVNAWGVENARPIRWTGPRFDALSSELAMEELQLQYDSILWLDT